MRLTAIVSALEALAPRALQEKWDNSGLQVSLPADADGEVTGVMLCVDVTPEVIAEAVAAGCNMVISHHPLIFKGLKGLCGRTVAERAVASAVRAGVAVYSAHTSLDSAIGGVSYEMARRLSDDLRIRRVLVPTDMPLVQVRVTCARADADDLRLAILDSAATDSLMSWNVQGNVLEVTDGDDGVPFAGIAAKECTTLVTVVPAMNTGAVREAIHGFCARFTPRVRLTMLDGHPDGYGLGVVADFGTPVTMETLRGMAAAAFAPVFRVSRAGADDSRTVRRVALCGGAGGEFIGAAIAAGADAYITADVRYHDFCDHGSDIAIFDVGHFESEKCTKDIFFRALTKKFPNFAVHYSHSVNPVQYIIQK